MNKFINLTFLFSFLYMFFQQSSIYSQQYVLLDDFENPGKVNWIYWDRRGDGNFDAEHQNPSTSGLNNSNKVARFDKANGSPEVGTVFFFLQKPFDLSSNNTFKMKVYGNAGDTVSIKLWKKDMNNSAYLTEVVADYKILSDNTWEEAIFGFHDAYDLVDRDKVVIQLNRNTLENNAFYFDDLEAPYYQEYAEPRFALTTGDGNAIELKCSHYMTLTEIEPKGLSIHVNARSVSVDTIYLDEEFKKNIIIQLTENVTTEDVITINNVGNNIFSECGWALKDFYDFEVVNGVGKEEVLVWSDEFNDGKLDTSVWKRLDGDYWFNNELQSYTPYEANSFTSNGTLKIVARKEHRGIREYTSARIVSRYNADFRFGRIECSMKMPEGQGYWSAFWMMPTEDHFGEWPLSGEIDIVEYLGGQPYQARGAGVHNHGPHVGSGYPVSETKLSEGFNTFTFVWKPDELEFKLNQQPNPSLTIDDFEGGYWPLDKDFHFIFNLAIGGWAGEPLTSTVFPDTFEVDYVRVYKTPSTREDYIISTPLIASSPQFMKALENELVVYPNPVNIEETIFLKGYGNQQLKAVMIDLSGKVVWRMNLLPFQDYIKLQHIKPGLYILHLQGDDTAISQRFIIEE